MKSVEAIDLSNKPRFSDSWRDWLKIGLPILLITAGAFAVAWHFVQPAPPKRVVIATGAATGMYYNFATQYADHFSANGVELVVKQTAGSVENYKLLMSPDSGVDIAIVQGGTAPPPDERKGLEAVAGLYYEPVWVFYRGSAHITRLSQLGGRKIAVGEEGSGVRPMALALLGDSGVSAGDSAGTTFSDLGGDKAADALAAGQIDALFNVISPGAPVIQRLMEMPDVHLMSFEQAHAYGRRYSFLSPVTLYEGSVDARRNLPAQDVQLVASPAMLVVRGSTHQAIVELLVAAAQKAHGGGGILWDPGTFPSIDRTELPLSKDAKYFLTTKPSVLHRTLPFWMASLIDRLLILLLPLLVVLVPLVRMMPPLYRWRIRSRIYRWYKRIRVIDEGLNEKSLPAAIEEGRRELSTVEREVQNIRVPLSYTEELYNLRLHVGYVRARLDGWQAADMRDRPTIGK